ncbi:MAG TPA: HAD-IB family phosphatase [Thermoanaerobaculia bacterium]|nr:HAD-IB family phosphatase [Thermoanaerobaculia bacterium]
MKRLLVLDMDGTVLAENSWQSLHEAFGLRAEEDAVMLEWYRQGILSYADWTRLIEKIYVQRGLATRQRAVTALYGCRIRDGARELVDGARRRGYDIALISGGVSLLVERVAHELGIDHWSANHRLRFDDDGRFIALDMKGDDAEFKAAELAALCGRLKLPSSDCYCIGNGCNDRLVFELSGHGILVCDADKPRPFSGAWNEVRELAEALSVLP